MRFQAILPTLAFFGTFAPTQAVATESKDALAVASALGVSVSTLNEMYTANITADLDVEIWTHALGANSSSYLNWTDEIKIEFLQDMKTIVCEFFDGTSKTVSEKSISKRVTGVNSAPARAQVQSIVAAAKANRDSSNRRRLLQCEGSQKSCTICAGICSLAWTSAIALCESAALGAETTSAGFLTGPVALALSGCVGGSGAVYAACIVKCAG